MTTRKPTPARTTRPLPRVDQLAAAGVALGAVALGGCKTPFEGANESREHPTFADLRAEIDDPTASLASRFATTSVQTATHDEHIAYPLAAIAAGAATPFAHAANAEPLPPTPKVTAPPSPWSTSYVGGAMAIATPRPPMARGAIRMVHSVAPSVSARRRP